LIGYLTTTLFISFSQEANALFVMPMLFFVAVSVPIALWLVPRFITAMNCDSVFFEYAVFVFDIYSLTG